MAKEDGKFDLVRWIGRSYAYRILLAIIIMPVAVFAGVAAKSIGGGVGSYLGLSENATMWVILGVFFMPLLVIVWWPRRGS
jgi:hypothetical protein